MSDAFWVALIGGVVSISGILVGAYVSIRQMISENTKKTEANSQKIDESRSEMAQVKKIAESTSVEVKQMTTGAFQAAYLQGVAHERHKNSDLGTLE